MSRSAAAKPAFLALSCVGFLAPVAALAAEATVADGAAAADQNSSIVVNGHRQELELESPKTVAPLPT